GLWLVARGSWRFICDARATDHEPRLTGPVLGVITETVESHRETCARQGIFAASPRGPVRQQPEASIYIRGGQLQMVGRYQVCEQGAQLFSLVQGRAMSFVLIGQPRSAIGQRRVVSARAARLLIQVQIPEVFKISG